MNKDKGIAIVNMIAGVSSVADPKDIEVWIEQLMSLSQPPADVSLVELAATGLVNALDEYASKDVGLSIKLLAELRQLHSRFPSSEVLWELHADGIARSTVHYISQDQTEQIKQLIGDLRCLINFPSNDQSTRKMNEFAQVHQELWEVINHLSHYATSGPKRAEAISGLIGVLGRLGALTDIEKCLSELRALNNANLDRETPEQLTRGLAKAVQAYVRAQKKDTLPNLLDECHRLYLKDESNRTIAGHLAWAVFNVMMAENNRDKARQLRVQLQQLSARFPNLHMGDPGELKIGITTARSADSTRDPFNSDSE